jgi:hypothetical protein
MTEGDLGPGRARRALLGLMAVWALASAPPAAAQKAYVPPRDAYGRASLEGVWAARWLTPLERPPGTPLALDATAAAARVRQILADRTKLDSLDPEIGEPDAHTLAIVGGEHRASLVVDPADGRVPLSEAGRAHLAAIPRAGTDGPEARGANERCLGGPSRPGMLIAPAGMVRQFLQTRDHVVIYSEAFTEVRILAPGAGRQGAGLTPWEGEHASRWDGDTLVVETSGFRADDRARAVPFSRFPLRPQTRITERFTRVGATEMLYDFEVADPVLYTRNWRAQYALVLTPERLFEFACHEGNYGLANILSGARQEERNQGQAAVQAGTR